MSTTSNDLRPKYNPLLWAQLRPSTRPGASDSSQSVTSVIPLMPENKTNTSLRVVLHDTKSALEQFSDRLGKLVDGVEHAKREIDRVGSCFAEGHDKILEELNTSINRSQKGLLETLGSPAQATVLEEIKISQGETNRKLAILEDKAELVQRQLHAISEQQGHILASLATITPLAPLLRDSPQQQTQILSMLASLPPMLPLLQSLQAQVKASQEEGISLNNHSVRSHVRQPVLSASTSSGPLHNPALSTVSDPETSTLEMPPPLMPPSQNELLRDRKRPRLTSNVDIQNRDTAPHRIRDTVTPARTVSNKTLNVRSQSGTTGAKAINRKRNSQQRKLLKDADEDVEIDLDWGDMV